MGILCLIGAIYVILGLFYFGFDTHIEYLLSAVFGILTGTSIGTFSNVISSPSKIGFSNIGIHLNIKRKKRIIEIKNPKTLDKIFLKLYVPKSGVERVILYPELINWSEIERINRIPTSIAYPIMVIFTKNRNYIPMFNVDTDELINLYGQFYKYQYDPKNYVYDINYSRLYKSVFDIPSI
jgi:hypothetical protein